MDNSSFDATLIFGYYCAIRVDYFCSPLLLVETSFAFFRFSLCCLRNDDCSKTLLEISQLDQLLDSGSLLSGATSTSDFSKNFILNFSRDRPSPSAVGGIYRQQFY